MASDNTNKSYLYRGMVVEPPPDLVEEPISSSTATKRSPKNMNARQNNYIDPGNKSTVTPTAYMDNLLGRVPQTQVQQVPIPEVLKQKEFVEEVFSEMVTETPSERSFPLVVLDCANIGHTFSLNNGFDPEGVKLALDCFRSLGVEVKAFIPSSYVRIKPRDGSGINGLMQTDDLTLLHHLVDSLLVTVVPAGDSDDAYILNYARNNNGFIVSNDLFNDHMRNLENQNAERGMRVWLNENRCGYTFIEKREFMINPVSFLAFRLRNHIIQQHITTNDITVNESESGKLHHQLMQTLQSLTSMCYIMYNLNRPGELKYMLLARIQILLEVGLNKVAFEDLHFILKRIDKECPCTLALLNSHFS